MKQPSIKIFGNTYKVKEIGFSNDGTIERIVYQIKEYSCRTVFQRTEMIEKSLTEYKTIQEPTMHPYQNYAYAPNLEALLVY